MTLYVGGLALVVAAVTTLVSATAATPVGEWFLALASRLGGMG